MNLTNEVTKTLQAYTGDPNKLAPRSDFVNDRRYSLSCARTSKRRRGGGVT